MQPSSVGAQGRAGTKRLPSLATVAGAAVLACPLFLLHGRAVAEVLFAVTGILFLLRSARAGDWAWLRTPWVIVAAAWWGWLVACSIDGGLLQAVLLGRYLIFVAALDHWALAAAWRRRWLARLCAWAALYIAAQSMLQFATGRNLQGYGRYGDGELTGPFEHPRAAAPLSRLLFPALLPAMAAAGRWGGRWAGLGWALAGVVVMVLIGQRMPLVLTGLGFVVTALLLPRLRPVVLAACVIGGLAVGATAIVSPPTFTRLVTKFTTQLEHFPQTHYGLIAGRAAAMVRASPVTGLGFDGFRLHCEDAAYATDNGIFGDICVQHPHNHYLQAAVEGGWPGLALFSALMLAWLARLGRGLWHDPAPLRVGLFVAALIQVWPLASASAFSSMPLTGWFFLLLGLGLAETRAYMETMPAREPERVR